MESAWPRRETIEFSLLNITRGENSHDCIGTIDHYFPLSLKLTVALSFSPSLAPFYNFLYLSLPSPPMCLPPSPSLPPVYVVEERRRDDSGDTCLTACWTALCCCCLWDMLT
uniref:Cysteine-rich and transmembrane domain-containing protein 1 n=1 Tax=Gadus morhua TaxID=8049 RepID=A0A8C5AZG1_GADMO